MDYLCVQYIPENIMKVNETAKSVLNHEKQQLEVNFRTSRLCPKPRCTHLETVGSYKICNYSWKFMSCDDISCLNTFLLKHHLNEFKDYSQVTKLFHHFFPNKSELKIIKILFDTMHTARGHPITIELDTISDTDLDFSPLIRCASVTSNKNTNTTTYSNNLSDSLSETIEFENHMFQQKSVNLLKQVSSSSSSLSPFQNNFIKRKSDSKTASIAVNKSSFPTESATLDDDKDKKKKKNADLNYTMTVPHDTDTSIRQKSNIINSSEGTLFPEQNSLKNTSSDQFIRVTFEFSAGLCVIRQRRRRQFSKDEERELLVIRRSEDDFYEVPKGHLECGETLEEAAERELREETGLLNKVTINEPLLSEIYTVKTNGNQRLEKTVHYFSAELKPIKDESLVVENNYFDSQKNLHSTAWFGSKESQTYEVRWVTLKEAQTMYWKSNTVSYVVRAALQ